MGRREPAGGRVSGGRLIKQSGLASLAALAAVGSGLLLDLATAALFGAGPDTDAFVAAARLPFALTAVLMVLSTQVLVPSMSMWMLDFEAGRRHRLSTTVLCVGVVGGLAVAAFLALIANPLLHLMAPGFSPEQHDFAVELSRLMVLMIPFTAASEVLRAWLNARHSHMVPAGMTLLLNITATAVVLASGGGDVIWVAAAYVLGAAVQFCVMFVIVAVRGFRLARPTLRDPEAARLARLSVRPTLGAWLNPAARIAETFAASFLPAGSMTILHYGNRLVSAVGGTVLFRSVMVTVLPRLTKAFAAGDRVAASDVTRFGIRIMAAVSMPLTALGVVLAVPITYSVFDRGMFDSQDARLLGLTLSVYAFSFFGSGIQRALLAPFYATRNTREPLANTIWGVVANLALLACLVPLSQGEALGVLAVAASYSAAQYVNVGHAGWRLRAAGLVDLTGIRGPLLRSSVAAAAGGLAAAGALAMNAAWNPGWMQSSIATLLGSLAAGALGLGASIAVEITDPSIRRMVFRGLRRSRARADSRTGEPGTDQLPGG